MSIEIELKELILSRYKSVRDFAISIEMPYSTLDSIFKRGVSNASITNIIKICETLFISADDLARGKIVHRSALSSSDTISNEEAGILCSFRGFNREGQEKILDYVRDLESSGQYKKLDATGLVEKEA